MASGNKKAGVSTPDPSVPAEVSEPKESLTPAKKPNRLERILANPKQRMYIFVVLFAAVGAAALFVTLAATEPERDLVKGLQNLSRQKPTLINGSSKLKYNRNPNLKSAELRYSIHLDPSKGNSAGNGRLSLDATNFPYDFAYIDRNVYFKLSNTDKLSNEIPATSPLYPYFSTRFGALSNVNSQWLMQTEGGKKGSPASKYGCIVNTPLYLDGNDASRLRSSFLRNPPIKVKKTAKDKIGEEEVKRYELVLSNQKSIDEFARQIESMQIVQRINDCAQKVSSSNVLAKIKGASGKNNLKLLVYMNKSKTIKKVTVQSANAKGSIDINVFFEYGLPSGISKPNNAKPADDFLKEMFGR